MEIWIATGNRGKIAEMKPLLEKSLPGISIHSTQDLGTYSPPPENGKTYLENARIKAKSMRAMKPHAWILAEDAGIEVSALNNLPGIHSARYAGDRASDSENLSKMLKMIQIRSTGNREAKFVCTLVALSPEGKEWSFTGELKGSIATLPKGQLGFGYDPIFIPQGEQMTLAELGPGFKQQNSHRAQATRAFILAFQDLNKTQEGSHGGI